MTEPSAPSPATAPPATPSPRDPRSAGAPVPFGGGPTGLGTTAARPPARPGVDRVVHAQSASKRAQAEEEALRQLGQAAAAFAEAVSSRLDGARIPTGPTGLGTASVWRPPGTPGS
ncbi:hypothetical protein [Kitasatospora sp. LaBMicrA B282]|uniref:hypothetical protein n=1 Tax=Kitasatospora sp. LaBMicrA B282 TaxID=3420949 RepID=UPI003D0EE389